MGLLKPDPGRTLFFGDSSSKRRVQGANSSCFDHLRKVRILSVKPTRKLNVAVAGLGFGAEFIPLWQKHPHTHCEAICQRNPERLNSVGDYFGNVRFCCA